MEKVKAILHIFTNSILPNELYYHKLLKTRFSLSRNYFIVISILLYYIFGGLFVAKQIYFDTPYNLFTVFSGVSTSLQSFPTDLTITIKDGHADTNYSMPYFMWMSQSNRKILLFVADMSATPDKIHDYNAVSLLTQDSLVIKNGERTKIIPLKGMALTINRGYVLHLNEQLQKLFHLAKIAAIPFFLIVMPIVTLLTNFVYTVISSICIYIVFQLFKIRRVHFRKVVQISMHAITLPLLINYFLGLATDLSHKTLPFMFIAIFIVTTYIAVYEAYSKQHHVVNPY